MSTASLSKPAQTELLLALRERYDQATRADKSTILNEFVALTGCPRKHAIRLLVADRGTSPALRLPAGSFTIWRFAMPSSCFGRRPAESAASD